MPFQDKNTYIYGASHLLEIGNLGTAVAHKVNLVAANNLRAIRLGMDDSDTETLERYESFISSRKQDLTLPNSVSKNCTLIDLHNCKYLYNPTLSLVTRNGTTSTNMFPSLKTLLIGGSNISSVDIGDYTPIEKFEMSDVMTTISFTNLPQLQDVVLPKSLAGIRSIVISNCPGFDQLTFLKNFQDMSLTISVDNLQGTEATAVDMAFMNWLKSVNATLAGDIYVMNIADENLEEYRQL